MADTYPRTAVVSESDPFIGSIAINYSGADQVLTGQPRGLLISTGGTLKVTWANGTVDTLVLAAGVYWFAVVRIWQTGSSTAVGNVLY